MGARRIAAYWAVAVAAALAAGCWGSSPDDGGAKPDPSARKPGAAHETLFQFEAFTSAPLVGGGEVTVASLRGQVVLLDIFGTWCGPCRKSTPIMVSLYERFHDKGLAMVGLAKELTDDAAQAGESVRSFREEFRVPYPLALCPDTIWDDLTRKAKVDRVVPTILLVDRHGVVRYLMQGYDPGGEAALADAIEELLAEPMGPVPPAAKSSPAQ
jgi:thiol-disulfide isomerase/thioredoxin